MSHKATCSVYMCFAYVSAAILERFSCYIYVFCTAVCMILSEVDTSMLHILSAVQLYYFKTACFKTGLSDAVVFSWSSYIATGSHTNNHLRYVKNKLDMSVSAS